VRTSLEIVEVKPGLRFSLATLREFLPDVETLLFFAKVYALGAQEVGTLLYRVLRTDLATALFGEDSIHSHDLQGYLVGTANHEPGCPIYEDDWDLECDCNVTYSGGIVNPAKDGEVKFDVVVPQGEILTEVWAQLEVEVAQSILDVATKLSSVVSMMPGKQGSMVFRSMMKMNAKRPTLGDYRAAVHHAPVKENLLILDVSSSMSHATVSRIVADVVALSYSANAHLAIVSNTVTYWTPGTYDVDAVMAAAEFSGTHYEQLAPLFDRDWGTVITVADYDSFVDARDIIAACNGRIDTVLDVSLVNKPTFLAECVGQLADEVRPLLIAPGPYVLRT
jgi:hypothetical protein